MATKATTALLEPCVEDTMLIESVKHIATEDGHAELEDDERFLLITDAQNEQNGHMDATSEEACASIYSEDQLSWTELCRVCANVHDHLIPIFEGEGAEHELCKKIHKYLPIRVSEDDTLPLQLCYHCAATLLAWHELSEGCMNAEQRLLEIQNTLQVKQECSLTEELQDPAHRATLDSDTTVSSFKNQSIQVKDDESGDTVTNDSARWQVASNSIIEAPTFEIQDVKVEETEYVECNQCKVVFIDVKYYLDHMSAEHNTHVEYCFHCKAIYTGSKSQDHMLCHSSHDQIKDVTIKDDPSFVKPKCKNKVKIESVDAKVSKNFSDKKTLFACHLCNETFPTKYNLKKHIFVHSNMNKSTAQNEDETELLNSAKQVTQDRISYKCEVCKKHMFTKRGFLRHIRVHSGKRPCKCEMCGKCYRIEQDLARHIRDVHKGLKKYICDLCERAFANKGARDDHRRIHTGERPYACEHCPKTFRTLNSIYIHNRVHTNYKPHKCSYCGKYFTSRQKLNNHETTHTGIKAFSCEVCGKRFSVKGEVMRHRAIHSQEKPFNCKSCNMKFGQKRYLRNHIRQHHKEESFTLLAELNEKSN